MKKRHQIALFCGLLLPLVASCFNFADFLKIYGFVELTPPSTLLAPGAMVSVVSRNPYIARIVCPPRASLGAGWKPVESPTQEVSYKQNEDRTFALDAKIISGLKADSKFQHISNITVTLSNPRIVELTDLDVFENIAERSDACWAAIEARKRAGFQVSMVSSGLMGDIHYTIEWTRDDHMSTTDKIGVLQDLAVSLGGGGSCVSSRDIMGKNLMFGIKDDLFLAALSMVEEKEKSPSYRRGQSLLHKGDIPAIGNETDSPVITPTDPVPHTCHGEPGCDAFVPAEKTFPAQPTRQKKPRLAKPPEKGTTRS